MDEDIKKILEENLRLTKEIHGLLSQIRRTMMWQRVVSAIYLFLIIAPIIFAIIYLPPLIKPYLDQYNQLLNDLTLPGIGPSSMPNTNIYELLREFQSPSGVKNK